MITPHFNIKVKVEIDVEPLPSIGDTTLAARLLFLGRRLGAAYGADVKELVEDEMGLAMEGSFNTGAKTAKTMTRTVMGVVVK